MIITITAGTRSQIKWNSGTWIFLDIGFAKRRKSCGLAIGRDEPQNMRFADAAQRVLKTISDSKRPINLLIEAPLSVCFDKAGNPTGRSIEWENDKRRYWCVGPGSAVMVAAMYLIREIANARFQVPIRLFEGFVSFKDRSKNSNHKSDVALLREAVGESKRLSRCIISKGHLRHHKKDRLLSAFLVSGLDCGIPVVIKRNA